MEILTLLLPIAIVALLAWHHFGRNQPAPDKSFDEALLPNLRLEEEGPVLSLRRRNVDGAALPAATLEKVLNPPELDVRENPLPVARSVQPGEEALLPGFQWQAPEPILRLPRRTATAAPFRAAELGTVFVPPEVTRRSGPLSASLYYWPTVSPAHLSEACVVLDRVCGVIRDRLGIELIRRPPVTGKQVSGDPTELGLLNCDPCGAYADHAAEVTIVFKPLRDAAGQAIAECSGLVRIDPPRVGPVVRFANVDVSHVLAGTPQGPTDRLHHVLLHALLNALARLTTKHTNPSWAGPFLVPSPNCDLEYLYSSAYGNTPEERARATAEGWKHYNEAILNGAAVRYVPYLDGPHAAARTAAKA